MTLVSEEAALCAPSSNGMYYAVSNEGIEDIFMDHISSGLHIFKHTFDNTSVDNYITEIAMALSDPRPLGDGK